MPVPDDTELFDVRSPVIGPFAARSGDRVVVRPGHAERPVVVVRHGADGWYPVVIGQPDYDAIRCLAAVGVLEAR
jgi:hypothetical protein